MEENGFQVRDFKREGTVFGERNTNYGDGYGGIAVASDGLSGGEGRRRQRTVELGGEMQTVEEDFWVSGGSSYLKLCGIDVLGKSGLGIVYKVVLGNGILVAVRRLGEGGD